MAADDEGLLEVLDEADTTEEPDAEEPDEDEDEDGAESPAEPEPEQDTEPDAHARILEIDKKLDGLRKHVAKRMSEILGEDAQFYVEDPISVWSGVPGWMPPVDIPPDVAAEIYHLLGQHAPSDYQPDKHSRECPDCNGFGEVATGSKIIGQDKLPCIECNGNGWQPTDDTRKPKGALAPNGVSPSYPPPPSETSAMPATPVEEPPEVVMLRQLGYAVIPPMVVSG